MSARLALQALVAIVCALALAACAGVLGIDEREQDSASLPINGYEGCRPGVGCDGCILPEHQSACAAAPGPSAVCAQGNLGECASCVCEHCEADVATCETSRRCLDIWTCLSETRCDLLESSETGCYRQDSCRRVIDGNGGLDGAPFEQAVAIRVCAVTSSCLSCLSPEPEPAASCSPENGCQGCADCFQQCVCSGDTFSACQDICGSDAPPSSCSQADDCQGCTRCFETCSCNGGSFAACTSACAAGCSPQGDCSECADCVARCECLGGDPAVCAEQCADDGPGACVETSDGGGDACTGCSSCFAECTCGGASVDECLTQCPQTAPCSCLTPGQCTTPFSSCLCEDSAESCADELQDCSFVTEPCDECPCDRCHEEYALCKDTVGCYGLFNCMRTLDCQGPDCLEQCGGGESEQSAMFATAEALWACTQGQSCSCDANPDCAADCPEFSSDGVTIEACCVEGAATPTCGLLTRKYFPRGPSCVARDQPSAPDKSSDDCPSHAAPLAEPYDGACFDGCRRQDGSCGYWDHITGLGCLDPDMFSSTLTLGCVLGRLLP